MGRMQDALKKAAEERERRRIAEGHVTPPERDPLDFEFQRKDKDEDAAVVTRALERHRAAEAAPPMEEIRRTADERLVVFHSPSDERAEEFRKIRANLLSLDPRPRTIMVTSGAPNEGKSLTAANLALTLLETGEPEVLLVDANLRYPELSELLGAPQSPGLGDVIMADGEGVSAAIVKTAIPGLFLLPAGSSGIAAARQLKPDALKRLLDGLRGRFGFIVIDTPSTCDYADAVLLSNDVDGVLVVVRVGSGRRAATKKTLDALEASKARVLGTVVLTRS
jgi:capsular exopolysaccharide synthesis family protein